MAGTNDFSYVMGEIARLRTGLGQLTIREKREREAYVHSCEQADTLMNQELDENKIKANKVIAFMNIAASYGAAQREPEAPRAYDIALLSRLALQINKQAGNDPMAAKLWTEAKAQLAALDQECEQIEQSGRQSVLLAEKQRDRELLLIGEKKKALESDFDALLVSGGFIRFSKACMAAGNAFSGEGEAGKAGFNGAVVIGRQVIPLGLPEGYTEKLSKSAPGLFDCRENALLLPVFASLNQGSILLVDYGDECEGELLDGIKNMIFHAVGRSFEGFRPVEYIDPIRLDSSALGVLAPLCGEDGLISPVPVSAESIKERLAAILEDCGDSPQTNGGAPAEQTG